MNILITGRPGVGKTTLIKKLAERLGRKAGGFYTEEIRGKKGRTGFRMETLDGKTGILASIDIKSKHRVGKYKVSLEDLENIALPTIESAIKIKDARTVIIDEIGPMELKSPKFKEAVIKALDSPNSVVATIKEKGSDFVNSLKSRKDVLTYTLDSDNREEVLGRVLAELT